MRARTKKVRTDGDLIEVAVKHEWGERRGSDGESEISTGAFAETEESARIILGRRRRWRLISRAEKRSPTRACTPVRAGRRMQAHARTQDEAYAEQR
eukprot:2669020-Pleurochrysis_carterae.AAC.1